MKIEYQGEIFSLDLKDFSETRITGHLRLSEEERGKLLRLTEAEDEFWYLDENGERLESKALFQASPWSFDGPDGNIKLLCRFQNIKSGEVWFDTEEGYPGELYKWVREQKNKKE